MDGLILEIPLFLFATFAGAFVAGLSGCAFGLVAASLRLYFPFPPADRNADRGLRPKRCFESWCLRCCSPRVWL